MYPCTKFQSFWKTSNFWTKFVQINKNDKKCKKIKIKIVISLQQCTTLRKFNQFEEIQIMGPFLPIKNEWQEFWKNTH